MRLFLFLFVVLSLAACSKGPDRFDPPVRADTLGVGWKKIQVPTTSTDEILDIFFINNTTGFYIAGKSVFRSTNGGDSWQKVYQSARQPQNLAMGSVNNILVTTYSDMILMSRDGGNSFDSIILANSGGDAFFVSPTVAYARDHNTWKTTNAGINWTNISSLVSNVYGSTTMYFVNEQNGWVMGEGFFRTINGGVTWELQTFPGLFIGSQGNISFPDANTGYIVDHSSVIKTSNGGISFTKIFQTYKPGFHDIHFVSPETGYITDENYILKTTNGGQTWTKDVVLKAERLIELHFTDAAHGWAAGPAGFILKYEQ